jgi:hypothetical protein
VKGEWLNLDFVRCSPQESMSMDKAASKLSFAVKGGVGGRECGGDWQPKSRGRGGVLGAAGVSLTGEAGSDAEMSMIISNALRHTVWCFDLVDDDEDGGDADGGCGATHGGALRKSLVRANMPNSSLPERLRRFTLGLIEREGVKELATEDEENIEDDKEEDLSCPGTGRTRRRLARLDGVVKLLLLRLRTMRWHFNGDRKL